MNGRLPGDTRFGELMTGELTAGALTAGGPTGDPAAGGLLTGETRPGLLLHERFLRGLATAPQRPAFVAGGRAVSYQQAHRTALTWAGTLLAALAEPPAAVGVLANKDTTAYLGTLAALYAGAAVVPLHPDFPAARTEHAIAAAGVSCVITDARGAASPALARLPTLVPAAAPTVSPGCDIPVDRAGKCHIVAEPGLALSEPRGAKPDDPAYVLFTSGSTGPPKGVPVLHRNTAHYFGLFDANYDFGPRDVFSQTFDLTFDCAMFDLFNAWGAGACVVPVDLGELRRLPWFAAEHGLTVWFSVPSCIGFVRRAGALSAGGLAGLRWSGFIGEPLHCDDARDWQAAAPRSVVENVYGPTELTISISTHRWSGAASRERAVNGVVPIGAIHAGHDYVLAIPGGADGRSPDDPGLDGASSDGRSSDGADSDGGSGNGVMVVSLDDRQTMDGELCVTGPQMFAGYLDPRDDDGRFLHHDGRRWYRTGDVVRRHPGGELAYVGRADDQVQLAGMRVELSEVSNALRSCPGVLDAAAVAPVVGGEPRLVAFHTGEPVPAVELAGHLKRLLPRGMLPRRYLHLDEFPLNANRKVDRNALRERAAAILTGAGEQP